MALADSIMALADSLIALADSIMAPADPPMALADSIMALADLIMALGGVYGLLAYSSATRTTTTITATVQLSALLKMLLVHFTVLQAVEHVEWAWKLSIRQALHVPTTAAGPLTRLRLECTFGWDFHQRFAFYLASPVCGTALVVVGCYVACLCGFSLGSTRTTIGTMLVIGVYTFMPQAVSSLVTAFPCYVSEEGLRRMVYSPSSSCMEYAYVTATAVLGMFGLAAVAAWLIGYGRCVLAPADLALTLAGQDMYLSLIHISEPTRLLSISYAVFCLKKKKKNTNINKN
eukprot:TRINITY_DN19116_c0_g1_i13.p1 TRINITY_DN19116_c0_g1~~TRINITY_DN19116_c0_g1_i13.p1  ORF type:complete len:289 (+),score=59.62 TRINITY_DN19116_c0_g1_i13:205-1071(+)